MFKKVLLGMADLPRFGPHPGNGPLLVAVAFGFLIGFDKEGIQTALLGASIMGAVFGFFYLIGCHDRGEDFLYRQGKIKG